MLRALELICKMFMVFLLNVGLLLRWSYFNRFKTNAEAVKMDNISPLMEQSRRVAWR